MPGPHRLERVGQLIRAELVDILRRRVRDPRVGAVTVTAVDVSEDLRHARIFVSLLPTSGPTDAGAAIETTISGLNRASRFIRGELGRRLRMRVVPELNFRHDETLEQAEQIARLLDQTRTGP